MLNNIKELLKEDTNPIDNRPTDTIIDELLLEEGCFGDIDLDIDHLLNEEINIFNEAFSLDKLFKRTKVDSKTVKNNLSMLKQQKQFIKNKTGLDIDKLVDKYKGELSDITNLVNNTKFDEKSIKNLEKVATNKFSKLFDRLINDITDSIGSKLQEIAEDNEFTNNRWIKSGILFILVVILNSIEMTLFVILAGPALGIILSTTIFCPINEEIAKNIASKYIDDKNKTSSYNIVFNIGEFATYAFRFLKLGVNFKVILGMRIPAVLLHTVNTILIKYGKDKIKNEDTYNKMVKITMLIHIIFNAISIALNPIIVKKFMPTLISEEINSDCEVIELKEDNSTFGEFLETIKF